MANICITKSIRDDIIYLLGKNMEEHQGMGSPEWAWSHRRLVQNSGLDWEKWAEAQKVEVAAHAREIEFVERIPVCGE